MEFDYENHPIGELSCVTEESNSQLTNNTILLFLFL